MHTFTLPDISCQHCTRTITAAIHAADAGAVVEVDLSRKTVSITSTLGREQLAAILAEEGYPEKSVS